MLITATKEVAMLSKVVFRSTVFATIIAVALASISVSSVFAASPGQTTNRQHIADQNLSSQWKLELIALQMDKLMSNDMVKWFREWIATTPSSADKAKENKFAISADSALLQAEAIAGKHAGFDAKGTVTDREQAAATLRSIEADIHNFHMDFVNKLENLFF
jgi:hypothetical protein